MSTGKPEDLEKTSKQLKDPKKPSTGLTWLRHRVQSQAGKIDLMLLEGRFTVDEMANQLHIFYPDRSMSQLIRRVKDHIQHLQEGDRRDHSSLHSGERHQPHRLNLSEIDGKWKFVL